MYFLPLFRRDINIQCSPPLACIAHSSIGIGVQYQLIPSSKEVACISRFMVMTHVLNKRVSQTELNGTEELAFISIFEVSIEIV